MFKYTPPTNKTVSTSLSLGTLSIITLIVRGFWSNNWLYLGSWVLMLLAFLCLYNGIKNQGV